MTTYKDALGTAVVYADMPVGGKVYPQSIPSDATGTPLFSGANPAHVQLDAQAAGLATAVGQATFSPIRGATVGLTVGPTATTAPIALAAQTLGTVTSYRVRNAASSASPVAWIMRPNNTDVPTIPTPYSTAGTGGTVGDKMIDPGGVEVIGLSSSQQTALAAGTLYLSAITPSGGSAILYITPGTGV